MLHIDSHTERIFYDGKLFVNTYISRVLVLSNNRGYCYFELFDFTVLPNFFTNSCEVVLII